MTYLGIVALWGVLGIAFAVVFGVVTKRMRREDEEAARDRMP